MIEFVFRPSRTVAGKRVVSRLFSGRYAVDKGAKPVTVRLNTPDREIARKRLREVVLEKQREQEGIIAPKAVRVAAVTALSGLIDEYESDLTGRELAEKHVHDTVTRLRRMAKENGWRVLSDIRPHAFAQWRAGLTCSAKTKKEYQISAGAFLNWLVKTERLLANPLAKLDLVDVRGKQVRTSRAFSEDVRQTPGSRWTLLKDCFQQTLGLSSPAASGLVSSEVCDDHTESGPAGYIGADPQPTLLIFHLEPLLT